jgi:hypothetical protein
MGYYDADYEPKDTDILCAFRITPSRASTRSRRPPPSPASPPPRPGPWSGPTGSPTTSTTRPRPTTSAGPRSRGRVHRQDRLRHRPLRRGLDREPDELDHRQRLRLQGAQGAAPRGHADPDPLRQDLPGPAARDRDGARVPRQVRPPDPRRHRQAQARPVGQELRARRLRGAARRPRLHQGRREHQLAAVHALARPLPVLDRGRRARLGGHRRGQGPLHERHRGRRWRRCTSAPSSPRSSAASSS